MTEYREGQTATHPDGRKVVFRGGQWVSAGPAAGGIVRPPKLAAREQMQLDEARSAARGADEAALTSEQFVDINRGQNTGGWLSIPGAPELAGAFDGDISRLNSLSARMAPQQRVPGSGTTSDRDLSLYLQAVPGASKPGPVNSSIARQARADAERRSRYAQFLDRYARANGTLLGAEEAWQAEGARPPAPVARRERPPVQSRIPAQGLTPEQRRAAARFRGTRGNSGTAENPSIPTSEAQFGALPSGTHFIDPEGQMRVKP